jgi:hypothetical protein
MHRCEMGAQAARTGSGDCEGCGVNVKFVCGELGVEDWIQVVGQKGEKVLNILKDVVGRGRRYEPVVRRYERVTRVNNSS